MYTSLKLWNVRISPIKERSHYFVLCRLWLSEKLRMSFWGLIGWHLFPLADKMGLLICEIKQTFYLELESSHPDHK